MPGMHLIYAAVKLITQTQILNTALINAKIDDEKDMENNYFNKDIR